jgi:hypothetical protein
VTSVPRIAPAVAMAESRPTTLPVSRRSASWSLTTVGCTALSTAAGAKKPAKASASTEAAWPPLATVPATRTTGVTSSASAPPRTSRGPSSRLGWSRSASRPPAHEPTEIPASTTPMMAV